jgi:methylenetetrahydrofolate dehydrogenase (NADP+)/methenyltetrahydrofolate cyclohydrolase
MKLLDGKSLSTEVKSQLKAKVADFHKKFYRKPRLSVVLVGDNPASHVYVKSKAKACEDVGMESEVIKLSKGVSKSDLLEVIQRLNLDSSVDGILLQLPLPETLTSNKAEEKELLNSIDATKDVDCFNDINIGKLIEGKGDVIAPCTPAGIIDLLKANQIQIEGKHCVVIGRSQIVGKPMALLLLNQNATVTICHSKTKDIKKHTLMADIVIVAAGRAMQFGKEYFKQGSVVVDVGIHKIGNAIVGDVNCEEIDDVVSARSPVPGGVGPMTIAKLLENTYRLALSHV